MRRRRVIGLSDRDKAVIDLERDWGQGLHVQSHKLLAAQRDLGLTPAGYALVLTALIDDPAALEYDSEVIGRLRRVRQLRRDSASP